MTERQPNEPENRRAGSPIIATVIGDPAGIGPEVCVKALAAAGVPAGSRVLLIGNIESLRSAMRVCRVHLELHRVEHPDDHAFRPGSIGVLDPGNLRSSDVQTGHASGACGHASFEWVRLANRLCGQRAIQGYVMGPLDAGSLRLAGHSVDNPELEPPGTFQLRVSGPLRAVPLTEHLPIRDIAATVSTHRVLHLIRLVDAALTGWGFPRPRIAVAGLNPHAMFEEDEQEIAPAILAARQSGIDASGPISPDAVFREAMERRYDVVVTMYHDQGQIALKTVAFAGACTVFLGLPHIRIGVPHGTAFDIAGTGQAQHFSMLSAIETAAALATGRGLQQPFGKAPETEGASNG